jgi:hypothetical protein
VLPISNLFEDETTLVTDYRWQAFNAAFFANTGRHLLAVVFRLLSERDVVAWRKVLQIPLFFAFTGAASPRRS